MGCISQESCFSSAGSPMILALGNKYVLQWCKNNEMRVFADGDDISLIGSGDDELCEGREAVKIDKVNQYAV